MLLQRKFYMLIQQKFYMLLKHAETMKCLHAEIVVETVKFYMLIFYMMIQ
jgi:hypothetical protein